MTSDISAPCLRCAAPSRAEHHHREGPGPAGKGMGGTHEHLPTVPLCREHHRSLHNEEWAFSINGAFYVGTKGGDFRSPIEYDDEGDDPRFWTTTKLRRQHHARRTKVIQEYREDCREAVAIQERIAWMEEWAIAAAAMLSTDDEAPVHWRRVYQRVKDWETYEVKLGGGEVWEQVGLLGPTLRLAIAASDDPRQALDTALDERLAGASVAVVERSIKGQPEPEPRRCPHCGGEL